MKQVLIYLLFTVIYPIEITSQSCYDVYDDAIYLSNFEEYENLADSILDFEILKGTKNFNVYLLKSKLLYKRGQINEGFDNVKEAIRYGCDIRHNIFSNQFFKKTLSKSDSTKLMNLAPKIIEVPFKTANPLALPQLYQLVNWDQALSNYTIRYRDSICITTSKSRIFELKITRDLLRKYLKEFGYPDENEFGSVMVDRFDLVIIHHFQVVDICDWLKVYYDQAFINNKISPERYYGFYDRLSVYRDLPQRTGTFSSGKRINGRYEVYPIENINSIDDLREKLCLSPLHVFLKNNYFSIPEGYSYDMKNYVKKVRYKLNSNK